MLFHLERKGRGYNDARVGFAVSDCAYQWGADGGKVKTAEPIWAQLTVSR